MNLRYRGLPLQGGVTPRQVSRMTAMGGTRTLGYTSDVTRRVPMDQAEEAAMASSWIKAGRSVAGIVIGYLVFVSGAWFVQ